MSFYYSFFICKWKRNSRTFQRYPKVNKSKFAFAAKTSAQLETIVRKPIFKFSCPKSYFSWQTTIDVVKLYFDSFEEKIQQNWIQIARI